MESLTLIIGNKNYSSWSLRAWLALKQSGLDFTEIRIPLDQPETRDRLLQHSPSGKVPALRHGDLLLWESLAIAEYLAELAPNRQLWPPEPEKRAIARAVSAEMHAGFADLRQNLPMDCRARYPRQTWPTSVQADIDRVLAIWQSCRQTYSTEGGTEGDFLFGPFTLADAMFAPVISRFITYNVPLDPIAQAYADAVWALPMMQDWLAAAAAEVETIPVR